MTTTYENHNIETDALDTFNAIGPDTIESLAINDVDFVGYESIRVALDFKIGEALQGRITLEHNDTFTVVVGSADAGWYGDQPTFTHVHLGELGTALSELVARQGVTA